MGLWVILRQSAYVVCNSLILQVFLLENSKHD